MIVVDASAATEFFVNPSERGHRARETLAAERRWLVPEHWRTEVFSAVRGMALGGKITVPAGAHGIGLLADARVRTARAAPLLLRMWALRHNFSAYDAPYVVLAAERNLTLVTGDERLARAAVGHCRVQLV